jgi:hypothetical protein
MQFSKTEDEEERLVVLVIWYSASGREMIAIGSSLRASK